MKLIKTILILSVIFVIVLFAYIRQNSSVTKSDFVMDTYATITVNGKNAQRAVDEAFSEIRKLERKMSSHISASEVSTGVLSEETKKVVERALEFSVLSNGLFDITVKPLVDLWDITSPTPAVPTEEEVSAVVSQIGYKKLKIEDNTINMPVDLGGIAKGYGADKCTEIFKRYGIGDAVINLGGDIAVIGEKTVGIRNPFSDSDNSYMGTVKVKDCAVVTSGVYERNFIKDGVIYHHLLNPLSGYPQNGDIVSVTVIGESCMDSDALATIIYLMQDKGIEFANNNGVKAITLHRDKRVEISAPLKKSGIIFELVESGFYIE